MSLEAIGVHTLAKFKRKIFVLFFQSKPGNNFFKIFQITYLLLDGIFPAENKGDFHGYLILPKSKTDFYAPTNSIP